MISAVVYGQSYGCTAHATANLRSLAHPSSSSTTTTPPQSFTALKTLMGKIEHMSMAGPLAKILNFYLLHISSSFRSARDYLRSSTLDYMKAERLAQKSRRERGEGNIRRPAFEADHVLGMVMETEADRKSRGLKCLSEVEVVDELISFMSGGSETVASAVSFIFQGFPASVKFF